MASVLWLLVLCMLLLRVNSPDPICSTRTPEAVSHIYESAGLRYVWMPTEDMSDACRKLAVAQCALVLDALIRVMRFYSLPTGRALRERLFLHPASQVESLVPL